MFLLDCNPLKLNQLLQKPNLVSPQYFLTWNPKIGTRESFGKESFGTETCHFQGVIPFGMESFHLSRSHLARNDLKGRHLSRSHFVKKHFILQGVGRFTRSYLAKSHLARI